TQGDEIRWPACPSGFPHAAREQVGDGSRCSSPPPVTPHDAFRSGGARPVLMGGRSTRTTHFGKCGFSGHFLDTARPSHGTCWARRISGSGELYVTCRPGGEGHE